MSIFVGPMLLVASVQNMSSLFNLELPKTICTTSLVSSGQLLSGVPIDTDIELVCVENSSRLERTDVRKGKEKEKKRQILGGESLQWVTLSTRLQ